MDDPVYFYVQGAPSALELVVNKLGKDIHLRLYQHPQGFLPERDEHTGCAPVRVAPVADKLSSIRVPLQLAQGRCPARAFALPP